MGYLYTVAGWDIYAGEILLASFALILFAWLSVKGISVAGWLQTVMALSLVGSVVILAVGVALNPQVELSNLRPAFPEDKSAVSSVIAIVAVAPWALWDLIPYRRRRKSLTFLRKKTGSIMIFSILFGGLVYVVLNTITASVMPWEQTSCRELRLAYGRSSGSNYGKSRAYISGHRSGMRRSFGDYRILYGDQQTAFFYGSRKGASDWFSRIDEKRKHLKMQFCLLWQFL